MTSSISKNVNFNKLVDAFNSETAGGWGGDGDGGGRGVVIG